MAPMASSKAPSQRREHGLGAIDRSTRMEAIARCSTVARGSKSNRVVTWGNSSPRIGRTIPPQWCRLDSWATRLSPRRNIASRGPFEGGTEAFASKFGTGLTEHVGTRMVRELSTRSFYTASLMQQRHLAFFSRAFSAPFRGARSPFQAL